MPTRKLSGFEVRSMFLRYFEQRGHKIVHSSSLVPANDPTLLFTNAGMNQFKDVFLGLEKRDYNRATSSQKCVRAGGKHNDLENVGFTNRHHTFFEMLGNFSFGDYFKKDAIAYAWELCTSPEWFGLDKNKLYATIFEGESFVQRDTEAYNHWISTGVAPERIFELGMKENFWQMGDTGPCGPCSEIHYDMGIAASDAGHTDCKFPCECGRYVEIWNLVFMQFNLTTFYACRDHSQRVEKTPFQCAHCGKQSEVASRQFDPLPKPSVDTGAGLERVTAVMQGVISNYDTDLFTPLIQRAAELTGVKVEQEKKAEDVEQSHKQAASLRVIADHARASTFLISDGLLPSNEWRGYVLRKIIRRAIRHGRLLGQYGPFFHKMVPAVVNLMTQPVQHIPYPELLGSAERVEKVVFEEERRFARTLEYGNEALTTELDSVLFNGIGDYLVVDHDKRLSELEQFDRDQGNTKSGLDYSRVRQAFAGSGKGAALSTNDLIKLAGVVKGFSQHSIKFPGNWAFRLYETYGLPRDFIEDACRDAGVGFSGEEFDEAMDEARARARRSWKGGAKATVSPLYQSLPRTEFEGYHKTLTTGAEVLAIIKSDNGSGTGVQELKPGERGEIVLDHTTFYADAGGQVGDVGWLYSDDHNTIVAEVEGVTYPVQGVRAHRVVARQPIHVGDKVDAMVNAEVRNSTMRNHTGTHLLHAALRNVLGTHVKQAGSLVDPGHLRFDFSHFAGVDDEQLQDIEDLANKEVLRNDRVEVIEDVPIDVAVNEYKAMALFGEKYGDRVRVIRIGDFST
ncbi:MAG TPA: alanine--tRNA ligase, partial [Terriglobales bacterium]|nr:alanine--tRNA ligase [Terriglobales bacterium]